MFEQRFTLDGSAALEEHLARICGRVRDAVRAVAPASVLEGLLLGGGYGRGEGGVYRGLHGDQPYNDLEFYVLLHGNCRWNERKYGRRLHTIAEELQLEAGVEVEFKILSRHKLRRSAPTMFYYDLAAGHRCLYGGEEWLADCPQHRDPRNIPLSEAARLLMNRCAGLLFARERLLRSVFTTDDADFVARNQAKAQLAFGDVILTVHHQYHFSCRERHKCLRQLAQNDPKPLFVEVCRHHEAGMEFKLHPRLPACGRKEFLKQQAKLSALGLELWLWLEGRRLRHRFSSALDYACSAVNKCPETSAFRNLVINAVYLRKISTRYPREQLFNALAALLWKSESRSELEVAAFLTLWKRFH